MTSAAKRWSPLALCLPLLLASVPPPARAEWNSDKARNDVVRILNGELVPDILVAESSAISGSTKKVEAALDAADDEARKAGAGTADRAWIADFREALRELKPALDKLDEGLKEARKANSSLEEMDTEWAPANLKRLVEATCGKVSNQVKPQFASFARGAATEVDKRARQVEECKRILAEAARFAAGKGFEAVDEAIDTVVAQTADMLDNALDRVRESEAIVELLKGEDSNLCRLCCEDRKEEALKYIEYWRPPRFTSSDLFEEAKKMPRASGWIDVVAHGSATRIWVEQHEHAVDADAMFDILNREVGEQTLKQWKTAHKQLGKGVRLISCNTGERPDGIAQELAHKLGVPVKAPNGRLWKVRHLGGIKWVIHDPCNECTRLQNDSPLRHKHLLLEARRGRWITFSPNDSAAKELRNQLLEVRPCWTVVIYKVEKGGKKPDDVIDELKRINSKLDTKQALEHLTEDVGKTIEWELIRNQKKQKAIALATQVGRLGLKARAEVDKILKPFMD